MQSLILFLLFFLVLAPSVDSFENYETKEDAAVFQLDGILSSQKKNESVSTEPSSTRCYGFSFFPITTIVGHDLVGGAEFSVLPKRFFDQGSVLNGPFLQSYGLGLGYQITHSEKQEGFTYGLIGIDGDMREMGPNNIYGDLSYTHQFIFSNKLVLGGGFDLHFYFGDYFPYPVALLDWQVAKHTKLKINFDTGEIKQFFSDNISLSIGAQYDIFHYGFGKQKGYVMESTSGMVKIEYRLGKNIYARIFAKRQFWGGESIWLKTRHEMEITSKEGVSIRLQLAYAG